MRIHAVSILAGVLFAGSASAANWQSLGRINALIEQPDTQNCQQRVINHATNPKIFYYPNAIDAARSDSIELMFNLDVYSLNEFTATSAVNSALQAAYDDYTMRSGLKSIDVSVWTGRYPAVSINVSSVNPKSPTSRDFRYYPIPQSARQFYELQQMCPL